MTDRQHQPKIAILSESIAVIRMIIFPAFLIFLKVTIGGKCNYL